HSFKGIKNPKSVAAEKVRGRGWEDVIGSYSNSGVHQNQTLWVRVAARSESMPNTHKILIIEDDPEMRGALTDQLSLYEEYEAVAAENGNKGVQAAKAGRS